MKPTVGVPESHRDLLLRPLPAVLATMLPDGFPRAEPVRCGFDGTHIVVPAALEKPEGGVVTAPPRATILVVDPNDTSRWIEVRGDVETTEDPEHEPGATLRIRPTRVTLDAIHR